MDDQLNEWGKVRWVWLTALVASELAGVLIAASHGGPWIALQVAGAILALFLVFFGAYYFWRRTRARSRRQLFSAAIQAQATIAPRSVSDPNERAALDRLRQKFQAGLNEFTSRGRDIYKLPWYLIIGEAGSGKTEAIRHSGIDFPPGLQNELQGSGGTVNMDWWFTNHGVILDTAGRLLFDDTPTGQTPEWTEFLRLLKRARSHCPVNGLFIVLSVESLIKDSAEKIAQKASRMAQQLDLIQRTLDVRFPVYLLVSKCDLLTGFRDFFESIDDPLLQHQMFGWSNPDALDAPFRPDLIGEHLKSVAEKVRRRRLWLLRESFTRRLPQSSPEHQPGDEVSGSKPSPRRAEEVESLFALPESIMRLAPRLRRYLETIFVAGEWSAKPVFLRGIYFTSSMREGKALDEAIAMATGLPLDQVPEDESWERDRAFFLRDMFLEKVFKEFGLVTRATNTLKLLRKRLLTLYGTSSAALLLFLAFAVFGYKTLNASARREAEYWKYAAAHWDALSPGVVSGPDDQGQFVYTGNQLVNCEVPLLDRKPTLVEYHRLLQELVARPLHTSWVFTPVSWLRLRGERDRQPAQRALFKHWVVKPVVAQTRVKMGHNSLPAEPGAMARHRDAMLALLQLEADGVVARDGQGVLADAKAAQTYLRAFLSYLIGSDFEPDPLLVDVLANTYGPGRPRNDWPPQDLLFGETLAKHTVLASGLSNYHAAVVQAQTNIFRHSAALDQLVGTLHQYQQQERAWLNSQTDWCSARSQMLLPLKSNITERWEQLRSFANLPAVLVTDLDALYASVQEAMSNASASALSAPISAMIARLPSPAAAPAILHETRTLLQAWDSHALARVQEGYKASQQIIPALERDQLALVQSRSAHEVRWELYRSVCELEAAPMQVSLGELGKQWLRLRDWSIRAAEFQTNLLTYDGPLAPQAINLCNRIIAAARSTKKSQALESYRQTAGAKLSDLATEIRSLDDLARAQESLAAIEDDLAAASAEQFLGSAAQGLATLRDKLGLGKLSVLAAAQRYVQSELGFPVLTGSSVLMTPESLIRSRELLERLLNQLTNSAWASSQPSAEELVRLRNRVTEYRRMADLLVDKNGRVTHAQLSVCPPDELASEDQIIAKVLRWVQIPGLGPQLDLTKATSLAAIPLDRELAIYFRKDPAAREPAQVVRKPRWWILQSICSGEATPRDSRAETWRLRIPVADPEQNLKGHVVFDVQFPSGTRFPRKEDWPK